MKKVIGVKFRNSCKVYTFDSGEEIIEQGKSVIVETSRGTEIGMVMVSTHEVEEEEVIQPLKPVIRLAVTEDFDLIRANKEKEKEAFQICKDKIREHGLEMKLVDVEYTFDGSKVLFYFTADGRIDFRELVKDLASIFRTRIELRQIGVRDETKILGGMGICGRSLCCHSYLSDFVPVSIKMAKEQNLSLNPTKISGVCGRLMCCLKNEEDTYEYLNAQLPKLGEMATVTAEGIEGEVQSINVLRQRVRLLIKTVGDEIEAREYPVAALDFGPERKPPVKTEAPAMRFREDSVSQDADKTGESQNRPARRAGGRDAENDRRRTERSSRQDARFGEKREDRTEDLRSERAPRAEGDESRQPERGDRRERSEGWQNERSSRQERIEGRQNERNSRQERTESRPNERNSRQERTEGRPNERNSRQERAEGRQNERNSRQERAEGRQNERGSRPERADSRQNEKDSRQERAEGRQNERDSRPERADSRQERIELTQNERDIRQERIERAQNERIARRERRNEMRMENMDERTKGSSLPEENSPGMEKNARKERAGRASRPVRAPHISGKEAADAHEPASQNEKSAPFARKNGSVRQERPSRTEHFEKTERTGRRSYRPFRNRGQKQSGGGKTEG